MTRFVDVYLSSRIQGYPVEVAPNFSTQITQVDSGSEQANQRWIDALREISIPNGVRDHATFEAIKRHWLVMAGPARTWPWRDPTDFASVDLTAINLAPTTTRLDQPIIDVNGDPAIPDGIETTFYLGKRYDLGSPAESYIRRIYFPVVSTIQIALDGAAPEAFSPDVTYSISRNGGVITFDTAPPAGSPDTLMTWGGLFDIQVRFESDDTFRAIMQTYRASGFADIPLREVRFCED